MGFYLSPSVNVKEIDLSTVVPAVATSVCAVAGEYAWGPCFDKKLVTNESDLKEYFGFPNAKNYEHWFSASNFLKYGNSLWVNRAVDSTTALNAGLVVEDSTSGNTFQMASAEYLPNDEAIDSFIPSFAGYTSLTVGIGEAALFTIGETVTGDISSAQGTVAYIDEAGEILYVRDVETGPFNNTEDITGSLAGASAATVTSVLSGSEDKLLIYAKYPGLKGNDFKVAMASQADFDTVDVVAGTPFTDVFDYGPQTADEVAVVVTGSNDKIVEQYIVSLTEGSVDFEGKNNYIEDFTRLYSKYILIFNDETNTNTIAPFELTNLSNGNDGSPEPGDIMVGYDGFANSEEFDVNLIMDGGNNDATIQNYIIGICESRMDCVAVLTVPKTEVVGQDASTATTNCVTYKTDTLASASSYGAIYGNWKYQYDKFSDKYRWLPISGDAAGIFARTDAQRDPWFAPAGLNRGQIKNVVKFAFNPNRAQRDQLYKNQVNPVLNFATDGPVIFGQKTLQTKPSAFDRIDVRRLFIVLEKAISTASKYFLFEKNTAFTRRQLVGMIEPFLRRVQGRQGIYEFLVVCDERNNTPAVIDANELVCDVYLQPSKSAEFITLNFIATRTGVNFDEIIGNV